MIQFSLELNGNQQRTFIFLRTWNNVLALLDTGALFPVWTDEERLLKKPGGIPMNKTVPITGFGGRTECPSYKLKGLRIGKITYSSIPIAVCPMPEMTCHMILPATMFSGLIYEIDDYNHRLNVTIPAGESTVRNMRIVDSNGRLHILCNSNDEIPGSVKQEKETDSGLELLNHLDKLHSTELGIVRIKKNLSLDTDDVVAWCKDKISSAHAIIERRGKNWYVNADNFVITVNARSYTIITAHSKKRSDI